MSYGHSFGETSEAVFLDVAMGGMTLKREAKRESKREAKRE